MAKLIYSVNASVDGYMEDESGSFDFGTPDEQVHQFFNDLLRPVGTHLYGRRLYEVMKVWETMDLDDEPAVMRDFAEVWREADKVVYSKTLQEASTKRTRIEREFDPEAVRRMKQEAERDLLVGGPELAKHAFAAGLVDECHVTLVPVIVGGGKRALPSGVRAELEPLDEHRFDSGWVHVHYRVKNR